MGITPGPRSGPADALFTPVQQRVLALLYGQPDRSYQSAELIRLVNSGTGAVHRQLARLEAAGLVAVRRVGNQKHYQAERESAIFHELHRLILKTVGIVEPLRHALTAYTSVIDAAFVYGSSAKGTDQARSDVDLMVVSDFLAYSDIYEALRSAERVLARTVNPTLLTSTEWRRKRRQSGSFVARVAAQPSLFVIGSSSDLD